MTRNSWKHPLRLAALAKAFESTFEYVWKKLKREADQAGLEAYSPRDALRFAAQLGRIDDLELCIIVGSPKQMIELVPPDEALSRPASHHPSCQCSHT